MTAWTGGRRTAALTILGLSVVMLIAAADYASGHELGLSIFYALPVLVAARRAGLGPGVLLAVSAALAWMLVDAVSGAEYSRAWIRAWNAMSRLGFYLLAVAAARLRSDLEEERTRARTDELTGILNRRGFLEDAAREIHRARRNGRPLTLACLDCDDFKVVNDRAGHEAGNRVLEGVGTALRSVLRSGDLAARLGGDEFAVLLPETGADQARAALARMREALLATTGATGFRVTFSIGAVVSRSTSSLEALLAEADQAMYRAKEAGKDRVTLEVLTPP